jgi:hypothetical protein
LVGKALYATPSQSGTKHLNVDSYVTTFINAEWFWHGAAWLFVSSFPMGVVSLFGIQQQGAKMILWKAVIGIIVSSVFGFFVFALWCATGWGF